MASLQEHSSNSPDHQFPSRILFDRSISAIYSKTNYKQYATRVCRYGLLNSYTNAMYIRDENAGLPIDFPLSAKEKQELLDGGYFFGKFKQ